ncbi:MAG: hypothetical protein JXQ73_26620 [Phycisphaerae bacterium]|nr:hypothetical protein [Phycisphaerae bacterium]
MSFITDLKDIDEADRLRVGGKAWALCRLIGRGLTVPGGLVIRGDAYDAYVSRTGLRERILLELNRKDFRDMRWEEMWDASLRIRNMFLRSAMPDDLADEIAKAVADKIGKRPVVVRSSAAQEDSAKTSFAGLHESIVNVRGTAAVLDAVRTVWASLWSDAALLYRQELDLDVEASTMAVVIQEIVDGRTSGVVFSRGFDEPDHAVIEAVHGLNQGLVDGSVEPDRWIVDRSSGRIVSHHAPRRDRILVACPEGTRLEALPESAAADPPLSENDVARVRELAAACESIFGAAQDVEWTIRDDVLYALQSRPITTPTAGDQDDRRWYLTLRRSFDNLRTLRDRIEGELIPAMIEEARRLAETSVAALSDAELADEIQRRRACHKKWVDVYWAEFIPFAHGARLFGQVYNDAVRPKDPYEFVDLLRETKMVSVQRNRMLEDMARQLRETPGLAEKAGLGQLDESSPFVRTLETFIARFGDQSLPMDRIEQRREKLIGLLFEMARRPTAKSAAKDPEALAQAFLLQFKDEERSRAAELLDLARTSYRLRDDDNIYLGKIESQLLAATDEGRRRLEARVPFDPSGIEPDDVARALRDPGFIPEPPTVDAEPTREFDIKPRQLTGQPAGPGIATGSARLIRTRSDLFAFKVGEVLVCDAIDPNMTFVVPLAAGIVERRGGMLIHGAIIAREYARPCVTGVPDATELIRTGDRVTVDGHLGIVTVSQSD